MALLDMLRRQPDLELVAAHVNHGIRADSAKDAKLARLFCMSHNIEYVETTLHLGAAASEDRARQARYAFLQHCRIQFKTRAIITAHHQDDLLETVLINLLRGTGWRGLAPFNQPHIVRPLLDVNKTELVDYAKTHVVPWREDPTNSDQSYLRNYVRHTVMPKLDKDKPDWRVTVLRLVRNQADVRRKIDAAGLVWLKTNLVAEGEAWQLDRHQLIMLPRPEARELIQQIARSKLGHSLLTSTAERLLYFAKVAKPGKRLPLGQDGTARVTARLLIVEPSPVVVS